MVKLKCQFNSTTFLNYLLDWYFIVIIIQYNLIWDDWPKHDFVVYVVVVVVIIVFIYFFNSWPTSNSYFCFGLLQKCYVIGYL